MYSKIVDYVKKTPGNTNPSVVNSMVAEETKVAAKEVVQKLEESGRIGWETEDFKKIELDLQKSYEVIKLGDDLTLLAISNMVLTEEDLANISALGFVGDRQIPESENPPIELTYISPGVYVINEFMGLIITAPNESLPIGFYATLGGFEWLSDQGLTKCIFSFGKPEVYQIDRKYIPGGPGYKEKYKQTYIVDADKLDQAASEAYGAPAMKLTSEVVNFYEINSITLLGKTLNASFYDGRSWAVIFSISDDLKCAVFSRPGHTFVGHYIEPGTYLMYFDASVGGIEEHLALLPTEVVLDFEKFHEMEQEYSPFVTIEFPSIVTEYIFNPQSLDIRFERDLFSLSNLIGTKLGKHFAPAILKFKNRKAIEENPDDYSYSGYEYIAVTTEVNCQDAIPDYYFKGPKGHRFRLGYNSQDVYGIENLDFGS